MRIGVAVGGFHEGNTSEYVIRAFTSLGHYAELLNPETLREASSNGRFDLYFCVDSGETLSLASLPPPVLRRTAFWFIDYRHNKDRPTRIPTDEENARVLSDAGGWIFQAQYQDSDDCGAKGISRSSWLPMAADPEIWCDTPAQNKQFDVMFIGNIWDEGRLRAVQAIERSPLRAALICNGQLWKERAASALRQARIGFNIGSWYGTEHAFDLNMRFFETLSCGVPMVTSAVPGIARLFAERPSFLRTYDALEEIVPTLTAGLADERFIASGGEARAWILAGHTYRHRMEQALQVCRQRLELAKDDGHE